MIRQAILADLQPIYSLYQKVISANPNNLISRWKSFFKRAMPQATLRGRREV